MNKKSFEIANAITSITQAGLTVIVPVIICIWGGNFIVKKFSLPEYVMVIAVVLGVLSGFYSMFKYLFTVTRTQTKEDK